MIRKTVEKSADPVTVRNAILALSVRTTVSRHAKGGSNEGTSKDSSWRACSCGMDSGGC